MTKKQWLENMKSRKPDYSGLIKLKDKSLLRYLSTELTNELISINNAAELKRASRYVKRFIDNVLGDSGTDFVLSRKERKWLKEKPYK